jgi:glycosyltransferase involved in cell wall biosynthesis
LHWVDEIVVVDSFSTDRTLDIARRFTPRVEQRAWPGFRDQYQFASERCTHDWALFLDADEEISPGLAQEMQQALRANAALPEAQQAVAFRIERRTYYLGRWHLHGGWVPDHEKRLYRRSRGRWEGGLHATVQVQGPVRALRHYCYHYTYSDLSDQLGTIDRYSASAVQDMLAAGQAFSLVRMLGNPLAHFVRDYLLKGGFREGLPGLIVAVNTMFFVFVKYAKLWEARQSYPPFGDRARLP